VLSVKECLAVVQTNVWQESFGKRYTLHFCLVHNLRFCHY